MQSVCDNHRCVLNADLESLHSELKQLHTHAITRASQQADRRENNSQEGSMVIRGKA